MTARSPLGLHLPDADQFTNAEISAVYDLKPSVLLAMSSDALFDSAFLGSVSHILGVRSSP